MEKTLTRTINTKRPKVVFGSMEKYMKSKAEKERLEKEHQDREMYQKNDLYTGRFLIHFPCNIVENQICYFYPYIFH